MDHKRVILVMMLLCVLILAASVAATTMNQSSRNADSRTHHPADYALYSESEDFVWNGRTVLEGDHGFPSMSMERHNKRDVEALLSFKKLIRRDPHGKLSNWTAENSNDVCSWYGITCKQYTRSVVALILADDKLEGTLAPFLGNLSFLQTLNLSGNNFTGAIPPKFGQLKKLRILDLSSNWMLGGSVAKSLSN